MTTLLNIIFIILSVFNLYAIFPSKSLFGIDENTIFKYKFKIFFITIIPYVIIGIQLKYF